MLKTTVLKRSGYPEKLGLLSGFDKLHLKNW